MMFHKVFIGLSLSGTLDCSECVMEEGL